MKKKKQVIKKSVNPWLTIRIDEELRDRLLKFKDANRRPTLSDAVRVIIEDRLNKDEKRFKCDGCHKYLPQDQIGKTYRDGVVYCECCVDTN